MMPAPDSTLRAPVLDWIVTLVAATGYAGVALLMFAENLFPPIPSELIMPLAGFVAARGELDPALVVLAGTLGSLLGVSVWYALGRAFGLERLRRASARHGRWLALAPAELDAAERWFVRHGDAAVLFGRLLPAVRTLISVPAGVTRMRLGRFLPLSGIGGALWATLLVALGYALEARYALVAEWVDPLANAVVAALLALYLYRVATFESRVRRRARAGRRVGESTAAHGDALGAPSPPARYGRLTLPSADGDGKGGYAVRPPSPAPGDGSRTRRKRRR